MTRLRSPLLIALVAIATLACGGREATEAKSPRWVVIGIDGAEWSVIESLWEQGRLPHLRALADRGTTAPLGTNYIASPMIWTTIATGVRPPAHGITGFVATTEKGNAPVSSRQRKVPALWNMLSATGRRVAVLNWWASWPAEAVDGIVVSDRAGLGVGNEVWPPELVETFREWRRQALDQPTGFNRAELASAWESTGPRDRDQQTGWIAEHLAERDFDLLLVYFRAVDVLSHLHWKSWQPKRFPKTPREDLEDYREVIPAVYEATDEVIGAVVAAAGPETNVMVLSDHGFTAFSRGERIRMELEFDRVLERLGYLRAAPGGGVDWRQTSLYTHDTASWHAFKKVRFNLLGREDHGIVDPATRSELRRRLERDLAEIAYASGSPTFRVHDTDEDKPGGADFIVQVLQRDPSTRLRRRQAVWPGVKVRISRLSGTHHRRTHGIFLCAGPDVDPEADASGIDIHDIAPTLLYALGLPIAEDFAGRARSELFFADFRARHPQRTIDTWGMLEEKEPAHSPVDEELMDELRALGYLD